MGIAKRRVLIADDNPLVRKSLLELFANHRYLEVCCEAENGQEAIEAAMKHRPDLVILDLAMPEMDGLEASKIIHKLLPEVPIILITLYVDIIQTADTAGFTRIIPKTKMHALIGQAEELTGVSARHQTG
ncbi:MAG: response regulator [Candidatus Acidiferrales bacterium]